MFIVLFLFRSNINDVERSFFIKNDPRAVNYYEQVSANRCNYFFTSPWGGCLITNCTETGAPMNFNTIGSYELMKEKTNKALGAIN